MLIIGLIILGLGTSLLAVKQFLSLLFTLVLSILTVIVAIFELWDPDSNMWHTSYFSLNSLQAWFLLILGIVSIASAWYRFGYRDHDSFTTSFWLPLFLASMVGVISANNLWVFMTAWELMSITSFFLVIAHKDEPGVLKSGYVYLIMSQLSAFAILSGFLLTATFLHSVDFSQWALSAHTLPSDIKSWIFILLFLGFGVKSGIIPFHIWLPRAHPIAPSPVSGLMSGAMIKLGVFGIMQFLLIDLGQTNVIWPIILLIAGAVSSLLGVLYALMEHNLKRLLAYHSIENIGIIFLGIGVMGIGIDLHDANLETIGMIAALFHALNHAVFKSQLFLVAGAVEQHTGTLDANHLGGLIRTIPGIAIGFLTGSMAISALPPFNGFASEWITFRGLIAMITTSSAWWTLLAITMTLILAMTSALAGMCFVKASGVIFLGQPRQPVRHERIPNSMTWPIFILAGLNLVLGVFSKPISQVISSIEPDTSFPIPISLISVHSGFVALLLFVIIGVLVLLTRPWQAQEVPRWSCGRIPDASMQFTSSSFTKSIRTTLAFIYRPHRKLTRLGEHKYFPQRIVYESGINPIWERYVYNPGYRFAWWLSKHSTRLQAGPVRLYLTYLLTTVAIMLLLLH